MANVQIKNSLTNTIAAKRSRYEKLEVAYGKILSTEYGDGDVLIFNQIPMKAIVHARIAYADSQNTTLELFHGTDISGTVSFGSYDASPSDISYVISYIKGGGQVGTENDDNAGEGKLLQLQVTLD